MFHALLLDSVFLVCPSTFAQLFLPNANEQTIYIVLAHYH